MKDYYIAEIAEETGNLFAYWADEGLDVKEMVTRYLCSHFRANVDKRYARFCTQSWDEMASHFDKIAGDKKLDVTLCEWLGYFCTYLQGYTGTSSKILINQYPFDMMYARSNVLHDLDMDLAVRRVAG